MDLMCGLQDTAKRVYHAYHSDYAEKNTMPKNCWSFAA